MHRRLMAEPLNGFAVLKPRVLHVLSVLYIVNMPPPGGSGAYGRALAPSGICTQGAFNGTENNLEGLAQAQPSHQGR
jgi:hypothetical protein